MLGCFSIFWYFVGFMVLINMWLFMLVLMYLIVSSVMIGLVVNVVWLGD